MISVAEASGGFSALTRLYKRLVNELIGQLPLQPQTLPLAPTDDALKYGMCRDTTYVVKGGMLGMRCQDRKLFTWDEGDLILPDAGNDEITYYAESSVLLGAYPTVELVDAVLADEQMARLWTPPMFPKSTTPHRVSPILSPAISSFTRANPPTMSSACSKVKRMCWWIMWSSVMSAKEKCSAPSPCSHIHHAAPRCGQNHAARWSRFPSTSSRT